MTFERIVPPKLVPALFSGGFCDECGDSLKPAMPKYDIDEKGLWRTKSHDGMAIEMTGFYGSDFDNTPARFDLCSSCVKKLAALMPNLWNAVMDYPGHYEISNAGNEG